MQDIYDLILTESREKEILSILKSNAGTEQFGLTLSKEAAGELMVCRCDALKKHRRVEFGEGILPKIIFAFCDSQYMEQEEYKDTLAGLQDIFYLYKNETQDRMTDEELIAYMKNQFETVCGGSLDYMESTGLERLSRAIRSGYVARSQKETQDEYALRESTDEEEQFREEEGWSRELYRKALDGLMD